MNKTDLIDQLAQLLDGNKKSAQTAVEGSSTIASISGDIYR